MQNYSFSQRINKLRSYEGKQSVEETLIIKRKDLSFCWYYKLETSGEIFKIMSVMGSLILYVHVDEVVTRSYFMWLLYCEYRLIHLARELRKNYYYLPLLDRLTFCAFPTDVLVPSGFEPPAQHTDVWTFLIRKRFQHPHAT